VQLIDGMVITPRIVGRSVGLAPLEVILTMMAAGSLFGFLGVLLAVPLGAVAKTLVQRAVRAYLASSFYNKGAQRASDAPAVVVTTIPSPPMTTPSMPTPLAPRALTELVAKGKS
jgi:hypothetical protein